MSRRNFNLSSRRQSLILRDPRNVSIHDTGKPTDRIDVNDSFPAAVGGVLQVIIDMNEGG